MLKFLALYKLQIKNRLYDLVIYPIDYELDPYPPASM